MLTSVQFIQCEWKQNSNEEKGKRQEHSRLFACADVAAVFHVVTWRGSNKTVAEFQAEPCHSKGNFTCLWKLIYQRRALSIVHCFEFCLFLLLLHIQQQSHMLAYSQFVLASTRYPFSHSSQVKPSQVNFTSFLSFGIRTLETTTDADAEMYLCMKHESWNDMRACVYAHIRYFLAKNEL